MSELKSDSMSTGHKVWLWTAIVVSVIVLVLAAGGLIGTWVVRGVVIDLNNSVMDGVIKLSAAGEEAAGRVGIRIDELNNKVAEIESAVDQVSQNVSDKGLVMTLLPPEKEQNLINTADQIGETVNTIKSSIGAALDLYKSIDAIPLVNLPKPKEETVQELGSGVEEIQAGVDQLAADIQDFRDDASAGVSKVSAAVGEVNGRLQTTTDNLAAVESELSVLQTSAEVFKGTVKTIATIVSIVTTLLLLWVVYGMVIVIRASWDDLQA